MKLCRDGLVFSAIVPYGQLLGVDSVLGMKRWQTVAKVMFAFVSIAVLMASGGSIDKAHAAFWGRSRAPEATPTTIKTTGKIAEASPPSALQELRQALDNYQPQVSFISPRQNEVLSDNTVSVRFLVKDLPIFKNETFGLGPHLHVLLDNRGYQAVYDTSQPLIFDNLEPGTHTIRAFASRPWHESFKNDGAFVQTTFHVFTKTQDNSPNPALPLLTYSRPQGSYGAEPILLDFYLTNAPLHLVAQADATDDIVDWRIRCTVNGDSFVIDRWQPLYLKGFKPGKNWVQLEYLDDKGNPVPNVFNNTVRLVDYQPNGDDTLSKLVRGELSAAEVRGIVDPNYIPPAIDLEPLQEPTPALPPESPELTPELAPEPTPEPEPESAPEPTLKPLQEPESTPEPTPSPLETPLPPLPNLEPSDRSSPPAPLLPPSEPSSDASPELTPTPLEPTTPTEAAERQDTIAPPAVSSERSPEAETESIPTVQPIPTDNTSLPSAAEPSSGQKRLRQVQQQLSRYLPQQRKAIAPPDPELPSTELPSTEPNSMPSVAVPDPLAPTLPEIIDANP
ncbi:hypothetical protein H6F86_22445 [Phormidium sp. FACHB-592]|uniref:FHA domain-containing protein n=1 Tax=Stenomitos frigidus AS-A4 TaxID=2933935 RepID=A0ABV0KHY7_9CYAN|nr:hypothetical protein [Phormidium sp. FACHB-592]MBD2076594.1 hypothetical protein [Phormidium sp. FACHB-592]